MKKLLLKLWRLLTETDYPAIEYNREAIRKMARELLD
jgi:hypothetical protein